MLVSSIDQRPRRLDGPRKGAVFFSLTGFAVFRPRGVPLRFQRVRAVLACVRFSLFYDCRRYLAVSGWAHCLLDVCVLGDTTGCVTCWVGVLCTYPVVCFLFKGRFTVKRSSVHKPSSRRSFTKQARKTHVKNVQLPPRGGYRL